LVVLKNIEKFYGLIFDQEFNPINYFMKKSVLVLILAVAVMSSACSIYTCPTYSQSPSHKALKETKF